MEKILVVDDEESIRFTFKRFLEAEHYDVLTASGYEEALALVSGDMDLVITDIILSDRTGIDLLRHVRDRNPSCQTLVMTGQPDVSTAADAVRLGAFDYLTKPVQKDRLLSVVQIALKHKRVVDEGQKYRNNLDAVFRSIQEGIVTVDARGTITSFNAAARRICDWHDDILGASFRDISKGCDGECLKALGQSLDQRTAVEIHRMECHLERRPHQVVSVTALPLQNETAIESGGVMVLRDESRLHALERDLKDRSNFHSIIGHSPPMQKMYALLDFVADTPTTVLITGESGTGKELVADTIHYMSSRRGGPLIKVNCAALPDQLLESELFGHVRGAFTDAVRDRRGRFEEAHGGTLFLDEIGDISPRLQVRLLRVLQERTFERLGESTSRTTDVRIIAATNRDLMSMVTAGTFREDLYYRLKVFQIPLPPLRERMEDIPTLMAHILKKINVMLGRDIRTVSDAVLNTFMHYRWPGNVRELQHVLEHAAILCRNSMIVTEHLPPDFSGSASGEKTEVGRDSYDEKDRILQALNLAGGNKCKAARLLKMSVRTVYRKLDKYGIDQNFVGSSSEAHAL